MRIKLLVGPRPEASTPITAVTKDPEVMMSPQTDLDNGKAELREKIAKAKIRSKELKDEIAGMKQKLAQIQQERRLDAAKAFVRNHYDTPMDSDAPDYKTRQFIDYFVEVNNYNGYADYMETATKAVWEHSVKEKVPKIIEESIQNVRNIVDRFADEVITADPEPTLVLIDAIAAVLEEEKYRLPDNPYRMILPKPDSE
ncbi:hypothetical protein M438DRAFT_381500 [Aureobasidium pullulans EXF-150]|uniref:Uncharacterized protein n=1 Tax=Aureobasidium pullulans EXF-150 TaxID=1043002 RepID=A0A074XHB5_AURPU|nr:uncharacterized protein M438DRAFT_381500 [Aureobasidium pullulans EXF-150]KEQ83079.1 hypothetical protein M438DRAFT_381500 [Aureobasidium pullulans EXF-150]